MKRLLLFFVLSIAALYGQGTKINPDQIGFDAVFTSPPAHPGYNTLYLFHDASSTGACTGGGRSYALCTWNGSAFVAPTTPSGGGGAGYASDLISDGATTHTIPGSQHGIVTTGCPLVVGVRDNSTPRINILTGYAVADATCDVTVTFASAPLPYKIYVVGATNMPSSPSNPTWTTMTNSQWTLMTNAQWTALSN